MKSVWFRWGKSGFFFQSNIKLIQCFARFTYKNIKEIQYSKFLVMHSTSPDSSDVNKFK
jgi:hypothetical protein